jgi:hypothetical protein
VRWRLDEHAQHVRDRSVGLAHCLNSYWRMAEELLSSFPIPAPVTHVYKEGFIDESDPNSNFAEHLSLRMIKGKWRICSGWSLRSTDPADGGLDPILKTALSVRVEAAEHLPGLLQKVVQATEAFNPKMDSAIRSLAQALGRVCDSADLLAEHVNSNWRSGYPRSA